MGFPSTISSDHRHISTQKPQLNHAYTRNTLPYLHPRPASKLQKYTISKLSFNLCYNTVLLQYVLPSRVYLHFQKRQSFTLGQDVFNSHVNLKIQLIHSLPSLSVLSHFPPTNPSTNKIVSNFHTIH